MPVITPYLGVDRDVYRRVLRRDACSYCGRSAGGTVDHITPRARAGVNAMLNLTGACPACNVEKASMSLLEFLLVRREARS